MNIIKKWEDEEAANVKKEENKINMKKTEKAYQMKTRRWWKEDEKEKLKQKMMSMIR